MLSLESVGGGVRRRMPMSWEIVESEAFRSSVAVWPVLGSWFGSSVHVRCICTEKDEGRNGYGLTCSP